MTELARTLRANATDAERILWSSLRLLKHQGFHFRRQAPFGRFVVDFACHDAKLIVEVDGSQHGLEENVLRDDRRTDYLNSRGYRVLRFWNFEVRRNLNGVVGAIVEAAKSPHPKSLRDFDLPAKGR
jgi:very-short-patch-repair endonuclease